MKKRLGFLAILFILLLLCGCATLKKKSSQFSHGLSQAKVIELWGNPTEKVKAGFSKNNYTVEVWTYHKKKSILFAKEEYCVLIFVDSELYSWAINDPDFIFKELVSLGALKPEKNKFGDSQSQKTLQDAATQAEQTRKMMEATV